VSSAARCYGVHALRAREAEGEHHFRLPGRPLPSLAASSCGPHLPQAQVPELGRQARGVPQNGRKRGDADALCCLLLPSWLPSSASALRPSRRLLRRASRTRGRRLRALLPCGSQPFWPGGPPAPCSRPRYALCTRRACGRYRDSEPEAPRDRVDVRARGHLQDPTRCAPESGRLTPPPQIHLRHWAHHCQGHPPRDGV